MLSLISCRSDIFRRRGLRSIDNQIVPQTSIIGHNVHTRKTTRELGKWEIPRVPRSPRTNPFLPAISCEFKAIMAGVGALIDKDPLPHSGAQSVSR